MSETQIRKKPSKIKKTRNVINLRTKLEILRKFDEGIRTVEIARVMRLPATTVRSIRCSAERIKSSAQAGTPGSATIITKMRSSLMEKMECLLFEWIESCNQKNISISTKTIQSKARLLYSELRSKADEDTEHGGFTASRGWFHRFQKRYRLNSYHNGESAQPVIKDVGLEFSGVHSENNKLESGSQSSVSALTQERLSQALEHIDKAMEIFSDYDPDARRSQLVNEAILDAVRCYKDLGKTEICEPFIEILSDSSTGWDADDI